MLNMANAASAQALEEGKKWLREFLESSETGRAALAMPANGGSFEMRNMNASRSSPKDNAADEDDEI